MAESCVFSKQSRGPIPAAIRGFAGKPLHQGWRSLSRSYGAIMPSSLARVLSSAFGYSPCLPVTVLVRVPERLARGRFWEDLRATCGLKAPLSPPSLVALDLPGADSRDSTARNHRVWLAVRSSIPRCSSADRKYRNINRLSIVYAFRPRLRSRLTLGGFTFPRKP